MKSLKYLYRIGSGPSSSHTMGPENASKFILNKYPNADHFDVTLYGSLAYTGKGHLTDYIIKKVLGENRTVINFDYKKKMKHPNTMIIKVYENNELLEEIKFESIGGGEITVNGVSSGEGEDVYPFKNFNEIKEYSIKNNISLSEIVYKFEGEEIKDYLSLVYDTMVKSIRNGLEKDGHLPGGLNVDRKAKKILNEKIDSYPHAYHTRKVVSYAYAVSEENASGNEIVTAPTCGASGVLPAVLYFFQTEHNIDKAKIIDGLAVASLIGNITKMNASISGAFAGCQSEIGTACSMAAAAINYMKGGTPDTVDTSAEIAMEHHLGLTCDPIGGLVQIPCIERNAVAALRALDAALISTFPIYPEKMTFDMVVDAMLETGKDINVAYKETSKAGLAKYNNKIKTS